MKIVHFSGYKYLEATTAISRVVQTGNPTGNGVLRARLLLYLERNMQLLLQNKFT
jgi:hypothetical protein